MPANRPELTQILKFPTDFNFHQSFLKWLSLPLYKMSQYFLYLFQCNFFFSTYFKKKKEFRLPIRYSLSGLTRAYRRKLRVPRLLHTGQPATSYLTRRLKEEEDLFPPVRRLVLQIWPGERAGMSTVLSALPTACKERISPLAGPRDPPGSCLYSFIFSKTLSVHPVPLSLSFLRSVLSFSRLWSSLGSGRSE